jgi:hypothetical protein
MTRAAVRMRLPGISVKTTTSTTRTRPNKVRGADGVDWGSAESGQECQPKAGTACNIRASSSHSPRRAEQVIGMRRAHPHAVLVLSTLARSAAQARDLIAVGGTNVRGTVTIAASASRPGRCVGGQLGFGSLQPWREVMCG